MTQESIHKIDELDELFASSNKFKQIYKFIEKKYVSSKDVMDNPFKIFYGLPFYRFDLTREEHLALYDKEKGRCCFNHFIGMPQKHGKTFPFFEYEKVMWEDFEKTLNGIPLKEGKSPQKLFAVLKATGIGMTEYIIRVMAWLAVSSPKYRGKRFAVIAGIRMNIAEGVIDRFVDLFHRFPFLGVRGAKARTMVNHVLIEAYPAVNLDAMRSFHNLEFVFVDEADFFRKSLQKNIRTVIERYIAKTNPFVYLVSTPDKPYGLFYELFREQTEEQCIYKRYEFDYRWGEGKIFTRNEIKEQQGSSSFEQEYNLQFGGTVGNFFSEKAIYKNVYTAQQAIEIDFAPYYSYKDIQYDNGSNYIPRSLGLDPGFGRNPKAGVGSYTGITLTQFRNGRIEILFAGELIQPDFNELVDIVSLIIAKTNTTKVFTDGSNPALVRALKMAIGEYPDYGKYKKEEIEQKIFKGNLVICPIPFNTKSREMLYSMKELIDKGLLVIHENQRNVIECLKSAYIINEKLDKERTSHDDLLDSLRLALLNYKIDVKQTPMIS